MNRVPRIFTHPLPPALTQTQLEGDSAHYLLKVLRVKTHQKLELFDGAGQMLPCTVIQSDRRSLTIETQAIQAIDNQSPRHITLCLALIKPERFEWALQKACELGVNAIQPIISERTDGRLVDKLDKKMPRWSSILQNAAEQSLRSHLPQLHAPVSLEHLIPHGQGIFLDPQAEQPLQATTQDIQLLIGPEGGWSQVEQDWARAQNFTAASLGPRILRAETAAITSLSLCQYLSGDLAG